MKRWWWYSAWQLARLSPPIGLSTDSNFRLSHKIERFFIGGRFWLYMGTENVEAFDKAERWMRMLCTVARYFFARNCLACRLVDEAAKGGTVTWLTWWKENAGVCFTSQLSSWDRLKIRHELANLLSKRLWELVVFFKWILTWKRLSSIGGIIMKAFPYATYSQDRAK